MDENPYQSPAAEACDDATFQEVGFELARLRHRVEAMVLDWFLAVILTGPSFVLAAFLVARHTNSYYMALPEWWKLVEIPFICAHSFLIYCGLNFHLLVRHSQTLGMRWQNIRFVCKDGSPVTAGRIFLRRTALLWPLYFIPGFNVLFVLFSFGLALRQSRFSLHDDIADTMVVKA